MTSAAVPDFSVATLSRIASRSTIASVRSTAPVSQPPSNGQDEAARHGVLVCRVERVEHDLRRHRVGGDLEVLGVVLAAEVLHGVVRHAGLDAARVRADQLVVLGDDVGVGDALDRRGAARAQLLHEVRAGRHLVAGGEVVAEQLVAAARVAERRSQLADASTGRRGPSRARAGRARRTCRCSARRRGTSRSSRASRCPRSGRGCRPCLRAGLVEHLGDERLELLGALLDLGEAAEGVGERCRRSRRLAVGQRVHAVAVVLQQRRVGLPVGGLVAEQAVHEHDRFGVRLASGGSASRWRRAGPAASARRRGRPS